MNRLPINSFFFLVIVSFIYLNITPLRAQSFKDMFISKDDGAVDMSEFLNSNTGFLPVPIIITEPAVGFGGGLALAYFHKGKTFENEGAKGLSPTVSFGAGALRLRPLISAELQMHSCSPTLIVVLKSVATYSSRISGKMFRSQNQN